MTPHLVAPDPDAWRALRDGALLTRPVGAASLRVTGEDRVPFLHGQLANDVRGLPVGGAARAAYLGPTGHALAEVRVHRREHDLHLLVDDGAAGDVAARLAAHVVFDQVEVQAMGERLAAWTLQGPAAADVLAAAGLPWPEAGRFASAPLGGASVLIAPYRRTEAGGVDLHVLAEDDAALTEALRAAGATVSEAEGAWAAVEASRVAARLARAVPDAGPGVLPQEAGLDAAISTRKGCYLGQETMARIEARGRLRRGLALVVLGDAPAGDDARDPDGHPDGRGDDGAADPRDVRADGRRVGRLGTVVRHPEAGTLALAVLRTDLEDGTPLRAAGRPATAVAGAGAPSRS